MKIKHSKLEYSLPEKSYGSILRENDSQAFLLNKNNNAAVAIDDLGREIWELCDGVNSVDQIAALLAVRYSSSVEDVLSDISETILHLEKSGFLRLEGLEILTTESFHRLDLRDIKFYVINCKDDEQKKTFMQDQLEELGLSYEFIRGVKCDPHPVGIALSHLKILRRYDLETPFAILEDDCQFTDEFRYVYDLPVETDALYLGISHFGLENPGEFGWGKMGKVRHTQFTEELLRVYNMFARHAIVYTSESFRQNAIKGSMNALTSRDYTYPGDIEYAMLHDSHLVLTPNHPACYQSEKHRGNHIATRPSLRAPDYVQPDMHVPNDMGIVRKGGHSFYLFLDVFVHWSGKKITAVAPYYDEDINWHDYGVDYNQITLLFGPFSVMGRYLPHRLDSWEPSIIIDFEHPLLEAYIKLNPMLEIEIRVATHSKSFVLNTLPQEKFEMAMSLVIKNENRWIKTYLEYYLSCMQVEHIYLYDNNTADKHALREILSPYIRDKKLTYIPWNYRWKNGAPHKQIGQPAQEVQCLNKYGATRWIGFFDIDEFLRIPGQTIPQFLQQYDAQEVGGISFGLRWFMYQGDAAYNDVDNPLVECLYSRKSTLGRKRQKLFVSPHNVRFMRFHWIEEGQKEVQVDDEDIYFHHYYLTENRFEEGKLDKRVEYDDYMLQFSSQLLASSKPGEPISKRVKPDCLQEWIEHVENSFLQAENGVSRLNEELLALEGMCGTCTRHFYNNLCNFDSCDYLEIGCWKGASLSAAMFGNAIDATAIDNWSEFRSPGHEDPREVFFRNVSRYQGACNLNVLEQDCFKVDRKNLSRIDIYLFDGNHTEQSQYRAIEYFYPVLADIAVVIIDDWNYPDVRKGTNRAIAELGINVAYMKEIILPQEDVVDMPRHRGRFGWWNGICVMIIDKQD